MVRQAARQHIEHYCLPSRLLDSCILNVSTCQAQIGNGSCSREMTSEAICSRAVVDGLFRTSPEILLESLHESTLEKSHHQLDTAR